MSRNEFAMTFPALNGEVVTQGHADYCAANGHASHTVVNSTGDVTDSSAHCPRCGASVKPETITDFSLKIADALTVSIDVTSAEVHKSTTHRGRYRAYTFNSDGVLLNTWILGVERNGSVTDNWKNVITNITL
jgi:hypothetical protein